MAIFGSSDHTGSKAAKKPIISSNSNTTIITDGTRLTGEITLQSDVYFDGELEGNIRCEGIVTVGKNGVIRGEIDARRLVVQGVTEGTVSVERIEIKEGGRVSGTLTSNEMIIEAKGLFEGESHLRNSTPQQEAPQDDPSEQAC